MTRPLVSLGLPVRNGAPHFAGSLGSLRNQTYRRTEILVADNASTDGTERICGAAAGEDRRVRHLRSERDLGAARNFNRLVGAARGKYFRWAAADDWIAPGFVARAVRVLESRPDVVLVYPKTRLIDEDGRPIGEYEDDLELLQARPSERFRELHRRIGLCNAVFGLIRLDALRRTGLMGAHASSDVVLLAELSLHGRFVELPERMFLRRFHPRASSACSPEALDRHYRGAEPVSPGAGHLWRWRCFVRSLGAIERAPCPLPEKARALGFLLRGCVQSRDEMTEELVELGKRLAPAGLPGAESISAADAGETRD